MRGTDRESPRPAAQALALALFLGALAAGCGGRADSPASPGARVLLVGVDGADWDLIDPMIERGELPAFARLRREGTTGPLESLTILLSPIIWTSIATGKTGDKHGIGWFMTENPKTGRRMPIQSRNRKVKAIWNILAGAGHSAGIVGWWATWPAEDVGPGFIVSDYLGFHGFGTTGRNPNIHRFLTYPESLAAEVRPLIPSPDSVTFDEVRRYLEVDEGEFEKARGMLSGKEAPEGYANPVTHLLRYLATMKGYEEIGLRLWRERSPELMAIYFEQVDSTGHLFMKYAPPQQDWVDPEKYRKYQGAVAAIYRRQDEILGRFLEAVGPRTVVIVVSDHGFKTGEARPRGMKDVDQLKAAQEHRRYGILAALGPGVRRGARIEGARVLDITPTLLHLLGEPSARDMDGRVLEGLFSEEFRRAHPLREVESYEERAGAAAGGGPGSSPAEPVEVGEEMAAAEEARLRALGYLSDEPEESTPEVHNNLAMIHLQKQEIRRAIEEFRKALALDPANAAGHAGLATAFVRQGRLEEARRELELATRLDPENLMTLASLGSLRLEQGKIEEAREAFRKALARDPDFLQATVALGSSYARGGDWGRARELLESAVKKHPREPLLLYNLGRVLEELGDVGGAVARYRAALGVAPDFWPACNNLGDVYQGQGRLDEAIEAFQAVVRGDPEHLTARYNLATTLMRKATREIEGIRGRLNANLGMLRRERAKEGPPSPAAGRLEEAVAQDRKRLARPDGPGKEMLGRAVGLLKEVIARSPDFEFAHNNLALAYGYLGDTFNAYRTYERMTRLFPASPRPWLQTAYFSMTAGKTEEAKDRLRHAFACGGPGILKEAKGMGIFESLDLDALFRGAKGDGAPR